MARTWLITGASRGLGRALVEAVLAHGDRVVATARTPEPLAEDLAPFDERALVLGLDVDDRAAVQRSVARAIAEMGALDVVVNNAGYGLTGGVEEVTEAEVRAQFETNFFGALWVTQAVLPHLRSRRTGHIVQISSIGGVIGSPNTGIYAASKWALEGMSEALAGEVAPFDIKVTLVEPSGLRTDWAGGSMRRASRMAEYDDVLAARRQAFSGELSPAVYRGDPALAAHRIIEVVEHPEPPLRLLLGNMAFELAASSARRRLSEAETWEAQSRSIDAPVPV